MTKYALFDPLIIDPEWTAAKLYASNGPTEVLPDSTIAFTMETWMKGSTTMLDVILTTEHMMTWLLFFFQD